MRGRPRKPLRDRLFSRSIIDPSGCILFTGPIDRDGYGVIGQGGNNGRQLRAHRVMYELFVGPIEPGMTIDHLCRVRHCVNPVHLEAVTNRVNIQRGYAVRPLKSHCQRGHPFDEKNTGRHPDGKRFCRRCQYDATERYRQRRKAAC